MSCGDRADVQKWRRCSGSSVCRYRPRCCGIIYPGWGTSPPPDDDRHSRANNPGQKIVGQRPQPVEQLEPVWSELNGCVFAGESAAPLPTALRYGKGLETRPIFTRTVCHSHAKHRPTLSTSGGPVGFCLKPASRGSAPVRKFWRNSLKNPRISLEKHFFSTCARAQPSWVGPRMHCWGGGAVVKRHALGAAGCCHTQQCKHNAQQLHGKRFSKAALLISVPVRHEAELIT